MLRAEAIRFLKAGGLSDEQIAEFDRNTNEGARRAFEALADNDRRRNTAKSAKATGQTGRGAK